MIGPGSKVYFWNIRHEFIKSLCGKYTPENTSKWKNGEVIGEDYICINIYLQVCASGMGESEERGKERTVNIVYVISVYTSVCKPSTTSNTTHWPDLWLLQLEWTFISKICLNYTNVHFIPPKQGQSILQGFHTWTLGNIYRQQTCEGQEMIFFLWNISFFIF